MSSAISEDPRPSAPRLEAPARTDGLHGRARQRAMLAIALSVLLSTLDYAVANVALPTIAHDIHCTAADSIWVINAYQLATLIGLLPLASLGEIRGQDRICRIGLMVFIVASALCAASDSLPELAAARVLQGLGGACIMSVNAALVRAIYPQSLLGRGIALNGLVVALGVALGPTIASAVLSVASWRWIFLINLPLGGAALVFAFTSLPATLRGARRFDLSSATLSMLALGPLFIGLDRFAHHGAVGLSLVLIAVGGVCLAWLVRRQLRIGEPLLPVDLLRLGDFRTAFTVGILGFIASNLFIIAMPFFFEMNLHRSAVQTGLLITPWPLAIVAISPLVGRLADRHSAGFLSSVGLLIAAIGFTLLWQMPAAPSDFDIAWRIALAGSGFGLFQAPNNRAMLTAAPMHRSGGASGMIPVARLLGQTIGAMLVALVFGLLPVESARHCLAFGALVGMTGAVLSAARLLPGTRPRSAA
ncbi:MFS transporter [Lichenicoccus sp.]|uniref:MFS transporter n=1 Tax=Lichenicoccus sp. TaxID=2781899 RepID=UPI003D0A7262